MAVDVSHVSFVPSKRSPCNASAGIYQLEAFVDQVSEREPQIWPLASESAAQLKCVEEVYAKVGASTGPFFIR